MGMNKEKGPRLNIHLLGAGHLTCVNSLLSFPAWGLNHVTHISILNRMISEHVPPRITKKSGLSLRLSPKFISKYSQGMLVCTQRVSSGYSSLLPGKLEFRHSSLRLVDTVISAASPLFFRKQ